MPHGSVRSGMPEIDYFSRKFRLSMRNKNYLLLLFILIAGSVLRLLFIDHIPFTHDEFSAMSRLHFNTFSDLIDKGVRLTVTRPGCRCFCTTGLRCSAGVRLR